MAPRAPAPALWLNILANYGGRVWSAFSVYAFVPLYIKILGIESYGVIAFQTILLGIIFIADAGISSAFAREVARSDNPARLQVIFKSLETIYALIAFVSAILLWLTHDIIASSWLNPSEKISADTLRTSVLMMGFSAVLQMAMSLYFGGLMGAQRHPEANLYQVAFSLLRSGLVLLPIYIAPDLRTFFLWQLFASALFFFWLRRRVWQTFGGRLGVQTNFGTLGPVLRFAAGMLGIAIISAANTQLDKLVVSKLLPLEELARYSLMSLLAQLPSVLTLPIAISILPQITRLAEQKDEAGITSLYTKYSFIIASLATIAAIGVSAHSANLMELWAGTAGLAPHVSLTIATLSIGHVFLALQFMPYHLAIAYGHNRTNIYIGTVFLILTPPTLVYLITNYGVIGAAVPWLIMNATAALLLGFIITRRFTRINLIRWWPRTVLMPIVACLTLHAIVLWADSLLGLAHWTIVAATSSIAMAIVCLTLYIALQVKWTKASGQR